MAGLLPWAVGVVGERHPDDLLGVELLLAGPDQDSVRHDVVAPGGAQRSRITQPLDLDRRRPEPQNLASRALGPAGAIDDDIARIGSNSLRGRRIRQAVQRHHAIEGALDAPPKFVGRRRRVIVGEYFEAGPIVILEHRQSEPRNRVLAQIPGNVPDTDAIPRRTWPWRPLFL